MRTLVKAGVRIWNRHVWADKAGGYGIQTAFGMKNIRGIVGDYYNVMGLPVSRVYQMLKEIGMDI